MDKQSNAILNELLNRMLEKQLSPTKLPDPTAKMQRPDPDAWRKYTDAEAGREAEIQKMLEIPPTTKEKSDGPDQQPDTRA